MLNPIKLQSDLREFFLNLKRTPEEAAIDLTKIIDSYIRSANIIVQGQGTMPPGLPTVGTAVAQATVAPIITVVTGQGKVT